MAEPLRNHFGPSVPRSIAVAVAAQHPSFNSDAFLAAALDGYESLDLTPRAWQITRALHSHLPPDYPSAIGILLASLGAPLQSTEKFGMAPFLYLPHVFFVASYGADHFEESMHAQYELTQRFSAEFSIRVFLEKHERRTLARLRKWASDPSPHVRRLVSEGTRPRLPWAARLRAFQKDPAPVLRIERCASRECAANPFPVKKYEYFTQGFCLHTSRLRKRWQETLPGAILATRLGRG
jgi:hypothetical protein